MTATILLVLLTCFAGLKAIDYTKARIVAPVVLNSLPDTKIKCDSSAVKGWCAGKHMTVKQWEAMQK